MMYMYFLSLKVVLILANSADPDEMPVPVQGVTVYKGLILNLSYTTNAV